MKKLTKNLIFIASLCLLLILESNLTALAAGGTGPYRRVTSKAGTTSQPYTYVESCVILPTASNVYEKKGTNDTAYVYLGGSGNGNEIDAGLQHSPTYDNWSPIILCKGTVYHPADTERFKGGQTVKLVFYVRANGKVVLKVSGTTVSGTYKTITTYCDNATGWKVNGVGNVMKRVTSIGQKPENLNSGSYLKNISWSNSYIGTSSSKHRWLANDTNSYITYPNKTKVSVNYINAGTETVSIDLR